MTVTRKATGKRVTYIPTAAYVNPTTRGGRIIHQPSPPDCFPLCGKRMSSAQPMMWTKSEPNCLACARHA